MLQFIRYLGISISPAKLSVAKTDVSSEFFSQTQFLKDF